MRTSMAVVVAAMLAPLSASAEPTTACHCYRDRAFDAQRPAAADEYILATTRSSFLSAAFGPSKADLIRAVMTGTSPEDLWISEWAASRARQNASGLLEGKRSTGSWKAVLESTAGLEPRFKDALTRGSGDVELAAAAVDDTLTTRLRVQGSQVAGLRRSGASTSEVILAVVLAAQLQTDPSTVFEPVRSRQATWGIVLQGVGLKPKGIDPLVRRLVEASR
jgi:hypothetical protein